MSGRKNVLPPSKTISGGNMSGNITSPPTNIQYLDNCLIQLNFTGTPTGTFAVQMSADYVPNLNPGNWAPLTLSTTPSAGGAPGTIIIDMQEMPAPWMRVVYTASSGSGSLDMYVTAKEI